MQNIGLVTNLIFQSGDTDRNKHCNKVDPTSPALLLQASLSCVSCTDRIETVWLRQVGAVSIRLVARNASLL